MEEADIFLNYDLLSLPDSVRNCNAVLFYHKERSLLEYLKVSIVSTEAQEKQLDKRCQQWGERSKEAQTHKKSM